MSISDLILNGNFDAGSFPPWVGINSTVTTLYHHTGFFAAQLQDAAAPSVIYQIINGAFDQGVELIASVEKLGQLTNPQVVFVLTYFDAGFNFLATGLVLTIPEGGLVDTGWLEAYKTSTPAPDGTAFAILSVTKSALENSAEVIVDDISLLATT